MKYKIRKQLIRFLLFIAIFVYSKKIQAQFTTTPTKISTPRGTVTVPTLRYTPGYYNYNYKAESRKHKFTVVLVNDSSINVKGTINIDGAVHKLEWSEKEMNIYIKPSETREIYRMEADKKITGIPYDSCWLFLVNAGKIKTYSITSETDYPLIQYIQKDETSPIVSLTKENILEMVKDNDKAVKQVEKGKLLKAISIYNDQ